MDKDTARGHLTDPQGKKPSEIGEAVDVLRPDYRSYKEMARDFQNIGEKILARRHRIFQLPKGIRWKIDEAQIPMKHGEQISRLKNEDDQWLLAFAIVEEKLELEACSNVVTRVLKHNDSIRDALRASAGVQCDKITSLLLPLSFDVRLAIAPKAWNRSQGSCKTFVTTKSVKTRTQTARELVCTNVAPCFHNWTSAMSQLLESHRSKLELLIKKMDV